MGRTMAVVLFTDLVGSTELRGRLGEEAADELRRRHDQLLARAVEANNGRVVKGLGDGIMATFAGAADAVAAAVAMQQGIDRLNRTGKTAVPIAVRVGLSAGDVAFEGDDVHGTPVIEASRLCGAAGGDEILVSEIVRLLASLAERDLADRGLLELKGLQKPVAAWEVRWEPAAASTIPMPALLTDVGRIFVGRDAEREWLSQLWKEVGAGEQRIALLAGEPGVGKTRLAADVAIRVHEEGGIVLAGRCDEDLGVPYQPFVEALRHFADHTEAAELKERLGRYGGELARLVPELAARIPDLQPPLQSDPETERYRLFDAVAGWLSAAAAEAPLVLILDDLQWAAKPTLLLLRHVVRSRDTTRLLILGTYRDSELTHDHPLVELVADLRRAGGLQRLPLSGLDDRAVATFVEHAAGQTLDDDGLALARAIHQETEGNPFFVREVLRHLAETRAIEESEGLWAPKVPIDQLGIPEGIRDVVGRRLARLSGEANQALQLAAVVGAEFEADVLQGAGDLPESALLAALDEAVQARLVTEVAPTRFRFSHALVRVTLYESLTGPRKVALHRHVAEAIENLHDAALDAYVPALAHHWARASAPAADTARAVGYTTRAGDRALAQLAHDQAAAYYLQALELLDMARPVDDLQRVRLLLSLGEAQRRGGDPAHRETLLQAARQAKEVGDHTGVVRAALANTRGALYSAAGAVDHDRVAVLEDALSVVDQADPSLRARILANLALELTWSDRERRAQLSDEALALVRRSADPAAVAEVLIARYYAIAAPDTLTERLANTEELLVLTDQLGDPVARSRALALRCRVAMEAGDVAEAHHCLRVGDPLTVELGQPALRWVVALQRVGVDLAGGDLEQAEAGAAAALDLGESSGQPDAGFMHIGQLAAIRAEQGRLEELVKRLRRYVEELPTVSVSSSLLALALAETGRPDEAREVFDTLARSQFADIPYNAVWLRGVTDCAVVSCRLGDIDRAAVLHRLLTPYVDQLPVFALGTPNASVSYFLGLLAATLHQWDAAAEHFSAAYAVHHRIGAPIWLARTGLEWARMLLTRRRTGDAERARELLGQALGTVRQLGLAKVERDVVALLQ